MSRRVGLSKQQRTDSLLKQIGGRDKQRKFIKPPPDIFDPPASSDDEDGGESSATKGRKPSPKSKLDISDSSDGEAPTRGDIKPTAFSSSKSASIVRKRETKAADDIDASEKDMRRSSSPDVKRPRLASNPASKRASVYRPAARKQSPPPSSGEHLRNEQGFTKLRKSRVTYKKKFTSSQELSAQEEMPTRSKKLKVPDIPESPQKAKPSWKSIPDDVMSPPKRFAMKLPGKPYSKAPKNGTSETKRKLGGAPKSKAASSRSPSPPRAVFRMPVDLSRLGDGDVSESGRAMYVAPESGSDLDSDDGRAMTGLFTDKDDDGGDGVSTTASCPWCGEIVEKSFLEDFSKGQRLNVRMQTKFCQKHKKKTALEIWEERRYPEVEWQALEDRFRQHREYLLSIVNGESSHFRSVLAENVKSGQARSMKKEGNLNPGYYGPRGFNIMSDYLVKEFGDLLKERAVDDKVISGRGSAAFIQSVLVAELAVQLIKEDMDVSVDEARDIMDESKVLGEMVHEEA